jgi:hypothetical protein
VCLPSLTPVVAFCVRVGIRAANLLAHAGRGVVLRIMISSIYSEALLLLMAHHQNLTEDTMRREHTRDNALTAA